nr:hypothetical protein [Tanacetum cinerariifolium]
MVKNLEAGVKFFMFSIFLQVFMNHQLGDMSYHKKIFVTPSLTKKVFANMKKEGKGFSRKIAPLFETMMVKAPKEVGEGSERKETEVSHTKPQTKESVPTTSNDPLSGGEDRMQLTELMNLCTNLQKQVLDFEKAKTAQAKEIVDLKKRVKKLEKNKKSRTSGLKRLWKGRMIDNIDQDIEITLVDETQGRIKEEEMFEVNDLDGDEVIVDAVVVTNVEDVEVTTIATTLQISKDELTRAQALIEIKAAKSKARGVIEKKRSGYQGSKRRFTTSSIIPADTKSKDKGKGIMVEEPKPLKKKQHVEMDEEYARKMHAELNKYIDWEVAIKHVKQKAKEDPAAQRYQVMKKRPQTEAQARKNMIMYLKNVAGFRLDYFKGMSYDDVRPIFEAKFNLNIEFLLKTKEKMEEEESRALQIINETPAQKAAKRRKLNKEVKDLKRHLEIVPDEDDDVYTEATPLARKVPVVDYEIINLNNKPYYKIIRADGTHQLYISFLTLLNNFDTEDLEALWSLVKERSIHGQAKVKSWKLLESCGVHIVTFSTTQLILLVERRYPLSRFTLDQMLNAVRIRVEEESEMSLELLRFRINSKKTQSFLLVVLDLIQASTPIETNKALLKDEEAEDVDVHLYRSMIGSLMYLTTSRPDIMFVVCAYARFQVTPKISHLHAMKRIFRYLKCQPKLGLWKSITGGCQFLIKRRISWQCKKQTVVANSTTEAEDGISDEFGVKTGSEQKLVLNGCMDWNDTAAYHEIQVLDLEKAKTAQAKEIDDLKKTVKKLERKKKSRTSGLKRLWNVGSTTRVESSEDKESLGDQEDASKQGRMIDNIDQHVKITLVDETQGRMNEEYMSRVNDLDGDEVIVDDTTGENVEQSTKDAKNEVSTVDPVTTTSEVVTTAYIEVTTAATTPQISKDELTLAQTLIEIKASKPNAGGVKDKGKGIMVEPEKPLKKKDQIAFDEEVARKLEAQMKAKIKEEERITMEKDEANIAERSKKTQAEVNEGDSKRVGDELEQESAKRQKLEKEDDSAEIKRCLEIVPEDDDDVTIKATPLSSKSSTIVDYKIYKEGKKSYFKIIRTDGNSQSYLTFRKMFKNFNREDLEVL